MMKAQQEFTEMSAVMLEDAQEVLSEQQDLMESSAEMLESAEAIQNGEVDLDDMSALLENSGEVLGDAQSMLSGYTDKVDAVTATAAWDSLVDALAEYNEKVENTEVKPLAQQPYDDASKMRDAIKKLMSHRQQ